MAQAKGGMLYNQTSKIIYTARLGDSCAGMAAEKLFIAQTSF